MQKEFCHICKYGKNCVNVNTTEQVYLEMYSVKCSKCGKSLIN